MDPLLNILIVENTVKDLSVLSQWVLSKKNLKLIAGMTKAHALNRFLAKDGIDVLFIDIDHPLLDELLESEVSLKGISLVLTSDNPNNALRAFDCGATDFLLKPFNEERFNKSIRKIKAMGVREHNSYVSTVKICVRSNMKDRLVAVDDILWIEAMGDYVKIITPKEKIIVLTTMKTIGRQLPNNQFLRTHRSYIVNLKKVNNIGISNLEINNTELPFSRNQKKLENLLAIEI